MTAPARRSSPSPVVGNPRARTLRAGALLVIITLTVACAGTSPDRVAFNTIDGATDAVQSTLAVFGELYREGVKTDPVTWNENRARAKAAYERYQATALAAVNLSQKVLDPTHQTSIVEMVSVAASETIKVIRAFGGK